MARVFTLPRKQQAPVEPIKPIKCSPPSEFYAVVKAPSGAYQVVNRSALDSSPVVVIYTASKRDWAIDWVLENDSKEAA